MFCPCVFCINIIRLYVPYVIQWGHCFSDLENFQENFDIPFAPQTHTLQYHDHSRYHWIWLIRSNLFVAKSAAIIEVISNDLLEFFSVTLSCKVPYFDSNFRVVTPRTAGCGFCFPATSVSGTITCIQALWYIWYAVWCIGGWLVLGLRAILYLSFHYHFPSRYSNTDRCIHIIMNSTNTWIHLINEFIYNWKSPMLSDNQL